MKWDERVPLYLSRRNFIIYSGISSAMYLCGSTADFSLAWALPEENYYQSNQDKFMQSFEETINSARIWLSNGYDDTTAGKICQAARNEFQQLLPALPYIGGDKHPGTKWLLLAGHWVSFMRPMSEQGYPVKTTAQMMYDLYVDSLNTIPKDKMTKRGEYLFSQDYLNTMEKWSLNSKNSKVDWVANFIPGDGKHFDYGIDYLRCPCWEYFKSQDGKALAPYFCLLDFPEHKLMGSGLVRTKTLAQGDSVCDFRYKKNRPVTQDWSTEAPKFS